MNLALDIGNSLMKAAVFDHGVLVESVGGRTVDLGAVLDANPGVTQAIVASVRGDAEEFGRVLRGRLERVEVFDGTTPQPLRNLYKTPWTLGADRLAAAVGAATLFPDENVMVADIGTAITVDLITREGEFAGGNISPGMSMRFRALHEFTAGLPLCDGGFSGAQMGTTTKEAICNGVELGIIYELEGYIARLERKYEGLKIIFTGGGGKYFAGKLKNTIFANCDLVVYGLNRILEYGDKE